MAVIRPFKALRPGKSEAEFIASQPYDVINREEAEAIAKENPISFLRVTRSEIELDKSIDAYSNEVYEKAKSNFNKLKTEGRLIEEDSPKFYLYRLIMEGREQTGIAACFSVDDYEKNAILKHEKTRKEKEDDRTNHIITVEAQTGPVFLTYSGVDSINKLTEEIPEAQSPIYDFIAQDGIKHTVWIIPQEKNDEIISEFRKIKKLYIADGHHRAASAARARKVKKDNNPSHNGSEEYNFFLAVIFPGEQLKIMPYNRVVFDLNGNSEESFFKKIQSNFFIERTNRATPLEKRSIAMYINKNWYLLKPNENVKETDSVGENLDVSILQNYLLNPILDIDDPRTNKRIDFIGGIRGPHELENLVNSGKAAAAFSMHPVSVEDLMNISDAGEIMPPKSTWFEPKLRDGLLIHTI